MVKILEETKGLKKVQNDDGTVEQFSYEVKNGVRELTQHNSYGRDGGITTERVFKNGRQVSQANYGRTTDGTPVLRSTTLYDAKGNSRTVMNPNYAAATTEKSTPLVEAEASPKAHPVRTVHTDKFGRKESTDHFDADGKLLYTDFYKYNLDESHPYEMLRIMPEKDGKKVVETYAADDKAFHRVKAQTFVNGEKIHSTHYDPKTQARTKEHLFARLPNPDHPTEQGFQLMTERLFDKTGSKVIGTRKLVNISGHFTERTPQIDKALKLPSGLRETLMQSQRMQFIKGLISKVFGKTA